MTWRRASRRGGGGLISLAARLQVRPGSSCGTAVRPSALLPQQCRPPALSRPQVWLSPAATAAQVRPGGSCGTAVWPSSFQPQQAARAVEPAGVAAPGGGRGPGPAGGQLRHRGLAVFVRPPAVQAARAVEAAGVVVSGGDERPARWRGGWVSHSAWEDTRLTMSSWVVPQISPSKWCGGGCCLACCRKSRGAPPRLSKAMAFIEEHVRSCQPLSMCCEFRDRPMQSCTRWSLSSQVRFLGNESCKGARWRCREAACGTSAGRWTRAASSCSTWPPIWTAHLGQRRAGPSSESRDGRRGGRQRYCICKRPPARPGHRGRHR